VKPAPFRYVVPASVDEAVAALGTGDDPRALAGGQSLVPMLNLRLAAPGTVVDLNRLPGLDGIEEEDEVLVVGAMARQRALERSSVAARRCPVLPECLAHVGHTVTRNRGTVGGSVAHADPAGELPLVLLALDGEVEVAGPGGRRLVRARDLFTGFLTTSLEPGEMVTACRFPATDGPGVGAGFAELAMRSGDFALASACAVVRLGEGGQVDGARVAVGAVADRPLLLPGVGHLLAGRKLDDEAVGAAVRAARESVDPVGSLQAPPAYQRHVVGVLVARALRRAGERALGTVGRQPPPVRRSAPCPVASGQTAPGSAKSPAPGEVGSAPRRVVVEVNGRRRVAAAEPRRLLSDFLRHDLGLRGTHVGCEHGVCGACTVRLNGAAVRSCLMLAVQVDGARVDTVEGLAEPDGRLHPLQEALHRHHGLQCGFCTPGILMSAAELASAGGPPPDEREIRSLLAGHLCRCTGYHAIVDALVEALGTASAGRPGGQGP